MRRIALPLLLALAVLGLAAACGGGDEGAGTTQTPATEPPPATETEAPATTGETPTEPDETITIDETLNLRVYLTRDDTIGVVSRLVPQTEAVGRVAMEELLGGPTGQEQEIGFSTQIPDGTELLDLSVADGVATVNLSSTFAEGGGSATMFARLAQVVYTLTQFPTVQSVEFQLDGEPVTTFSSEGIVLDGPQTRENYEDVTPPILVETPTPFATVSSPLTIAGTANVFEATVSYSLEDATGAEITSGFTTATCGTGCRGTFEVSVPFEAGGVSEGTLVVFESSAEDGSRIHVVEIPLTFAE